MRIPTRGGVRGLAVLVLALVPLLGAVRVPWFWDDELLLEKRLSAANTPDLASVWSQPYWGPVGPADVYRPLGLSWIHAQRQRFGTAVAGYHVVSLALHAACSLLVLAIASQLAGPAVGWLAALVFAAHPVHVEAVAMVYGQLELLCALGVLLAVWLALRAHAGQGSAATRAWAGVIGVGALASFAKETALMLPALLALVRFCWFTPPADRQGRGLIRFARRLGPEALCALAMLPYLIARYRVLGALTIDPALTVSGGYTPGQRLHAVIVALAHGLRLTTVPTGQTLYYGHLRDSIFGLPLLEVLWLVMAVAGVSLLRPIVGRRVLAFGLGWFLIALFPVANVIPSGVLVAERTLYLPSVGIAFVLGALAARLPSADLVPARWAPAVVSAALLLAAGTTAAVTARLGSAESQWRYTISRYPRSPLGHHLLAESMLKRWLKTATVPTAAELAEAEQEFARSLELNPENHDSLLGQGYVAYFRGDRSRLDELIARHRAASPGEAGKRQALLGLRKQLTLSPAADVLPAD